MENTKVNTNTVDWIELEDWLDKVCVPYPNNNYNGYRCRQHQEYRNAYNTYLYEFENC